MACTFRDYRRQDFDRWKKGDEAGGRDTAGSPEHAMTDTHGALIGRRIIVPETRELDVLAQMLERHGAVTIRCPLVAIHHTPDPVVAWLRRFVDAPR